jgi:hypothetical protein
VSGASNRYPRELRPIDWPAEITARTSPRGKLPEVREIHGALEGLLAWSDAGGRPSEFGDVWQDTVPC